MNYYPPSVIEPRPTANDSRNTQHPHSHLFNIAYFWLKYNGMKTVFIGMLALAFVACKQSNKAIITKVANADSIAINYFTGDGRVDSVVTVKIIKDKQQITQLTSFIGGASTEPYKCGYDGSLHYFSNGAVLQDVDFRMTDAQCMHFSFMLDGQLYSTVLSPEARQLLESIKK